MRVSDFATHELTNANSISLSVETTSDALQIISNDFQLRRYIEVYGDVVVEYDEAANVYRVPEFAPAIARYNESKTRDCQRWGCE